MKRWFGWQPFVLVLSVLITLSATAKNDDPEKGWTETRTDFSLIFHYIQKMYPCHQSEKNYLGCIELINSLGQDADPRIALMPRKQPELLPELRVKTLQEFGAFDLVEVVTAAPMAPTIRRKVEIIRISRQLLKEAASANFKANQKSIKNGEFSADMVDITFVTFAYDVLQTRSDTISEQRSIGDAVNAMIGVHDGHGRLAPQNYLRARTANSDVTFFGVGVEFKAIEKSVVIHKVMPGSAAETAGLKTQDVVLQIDGKPVEEDLDRVIQRVRGREGSGVTLQIRRGEQTFEYLVTRAPIEIKNLTHNVLHDMGKDLLHVKLAESFDDRSCASVREAIRDAKGENIRGIIFDLRGNTGGLLDEAVCIGGLFVGPMKIVGERRVSNGVTSTSPIKFTVSKEKKITELPMVLLINESSASASEIVAGALQDYLRAYLVGTTTFGKATTQSVLQDLNQEDLVRIETVARFYQPSGRTNQIVGIQPDFEVFATPNATEEEKFAAREGDIYPTALPPEGAPWVQSRATEVARLNKVCLTGKAEAKYALDPENADYQLLKAQELLACDNLHIGKGKTAGN
ncbi:MAG: PDZ domain-containing protein [Bdellovibrionales bacterium]|nr:PDZ domain-containing protein [Bdellovibrionales bacterium]